MNLPSGLLLSDRRGRWWSRRPTPIVFGVVKTMELSFRAIPAWKCTIAADLLSLAGITSPRDFWIFTTILIVPVVINCCQGALP